MNAIKTPLRWAYGLYVWALFVILVAPSVLLLIITPTLALRRQLVRISSRVFFFLSGMPLSLENRVALPIGTCIVTSNHASYLDGVILTAALPANFSFVIKSEVTRVPVIHFLLRRIGSQFVERFSTSGSVRDALRILRAAGNGDELAFFPEGTFVAEPGLTRFRIGAFAAATHAGLPVVPVIIHGSRRILPAEQWAPLPGRIKVEILEPVAFSDKRSAHELRDLVRDRMLAAINEPDAAAR